MKYIKIKIFISTLFIISGILLAGCNKSETDKKNSKRIIEIGAVLPLTGQGAEFAQYIKRGLDLAVQEINEDSTLQFRILYEDSKTQAKEGVSAYNKLLATEDPLVSIVALSSVARATGPIAVSENKIHIYTAVAIPNVTDGEHRFRIYPEAHGMAGVMARYSVKELNAETAGVIYINDDFGRTSFDVYENEFSRLGGEVVFGESYEIQQTDFKTHITKIRDLPTAPDVIYLNGYGPAYGSIVRQLQENNISSILTADMTMGLPNTLNVAGAAAEDAYFVDGNMSQDFISKYEEKYRTKPTSYAGYAYDIIRILYEAFKESEELNREEVANSLVNLENYQGAMGKIDIQANGESNIEFMVKKIINGKPKLIQ